MKSPEWKKTGYTRDRLKFEKTVIIGLGEHFHICDCNQGLQQSQQPENPMDGS